ncbi:MAG: PqiC family protein [Verrucomicrobiales bacterium]|nr:PqiC family protein [Verrucomicrobiales bacterium]
MNKLKTLLDRDNFPTSQPVAQTFLSAGNRNFPVPILLLQQEIRNWKVPVTRRRESLRYIGCGASRSLLLAAFALSSLALTGCLNLKRVTDPTRFYVLSAMPAGTPGTDGSDRNLALGIGRVDIPAYLFDSRIALRKGAAEIQYSESHQWAERLDKGLQRVLGANLSSLLSSNRVVLSAWQRGEVWAEVYLSVQRFECDEGGQVVLEARWRIATPGGQETLRTASSRIVRPGPTLATNPEGAVGELSQALSDLSREIAAAVQNASGSVSKPERLP